MDAPALAELERSVERAIARMMRARLYTLDALFVLGVAAACLWYSGEPRWAVGAASAGAVLVLIGATVTWALQFQVCLVADGPGYAASHLLLAVFTFPFLGIGLILIPLLVRNDVHKRVRTRRLDRVDPSFAGREPLF